MTTGQPNQYNDLIACELRSMRARKGIKQDDVVALSNGELRKGTVIALENAKYNVGIRQMMEYANLMGYTIQFVPKE